MAASRLSMRKLRELLRLRLHNKLEGRAIARSLGLSPSTVSDYLARARVAGLKTWPLPPELDDDIWFRPAMAPNWRSSGAVIAVATTSGLAPG